MDLESPTAPLESCFSFNLVRGTEILLGNNVV